MSCTLHKRLYGAVKMQALHSCITSRIPYPTIPFPPIPSPSLCILHLSFPQSTHHASTRSPIAHGMARAHDAFSAMTVDDSALERSSPFVLGECGLRCLRESARIGVGEDGLHGGARSVTCQAQWSLEGSWDVHACGLEWMRKSW